METILTCSQMKQFDRYTIDKMGVPSSVLMERAALSVVDEIIKYTADKKNQRILCVCGSGNNGGDGIAIARLLHNAGYHADILFVGNPKHMTEETRMQKEIAEHYGVWVYNLDNEEKEDGMLASCSNQKMMETRALYALNSCSIVVDALFGVGLSRNVEGKYASLIHIINGLDAFKVGVDIPSGINGDNGQVMGTAVRCDLTVTFAFRKAGHILYPGRIYCGKTVCADIGIYEPREPLSSTGQTAEAFIGGFTDTVNRSKKLQEREFKDGSAGDEIRIKSVQEADLAAIRSRDPSGSKAAFGKLTAATGSPGMCGAAYLSAAAAFGAGCGMVMIRTDEQNRIPLQTLLPEAMISTGSGEQEDQRVFNWCDVVAMGCGMGQSEEAAERALWYLKKCSETGKPLVLDADGLNLLASHPEWYDYLGPHVILTPHPGEMSRISGYSIEEIKQDPIRCASEFAIRTGAVVVSKDACTVIASPEGNAYINTNGNCGMGTAGSGDVLCGVIAGLVCTFHAGHNKHTITDSPGLSADLAYIAAAGVFLHGLAGDKAAKVKGMAAMKAGDIIYCL